MSQETSTWLNQKTLIGFTAQRGNAWHYRASEQGEEANHYAGEIPIEDVRRRLFNWEAVEGDLITTSHVITPDGVEKITLKDERRKTIIRPPGALGEDDPGGILSVFFNGYTMHSYDEWLLGQVSHLLDDDLAIGSAGLLKQGGVAWVQVEVPETIKTPEGVEFRPHLVAATSLDGSLSSTYARSVTMTVCDNTLSAALGEAGEQKLKIRHSRYSKLKLQEARQALAIVHETGEEFAAQVAQLCNVTVSDGDFAKFLDEITPLKDEKGKNKEGRSLTTATQKREEFQMLWENDLRVAPWRNTAFGVVQAANTWRHHVSTVRGGDRAERNMENTVKGANDKLDAETLTALTRTLAPSL